jgi:hypothetical protein
VHVGDRLGVGQRGRRPAVAGPHIESEVRRGAKYVRVSIVMTIAAADVTRALDAAWRVFRWAAGDDAGGWEMAGASAKVRPEKPLSGLVAEQVGVDHKGEDTG